MTMLEHIRNLFSYDDWANREVLRSLQTLSAPPVRSVKLLGHILSAERLWLERLLVQKQSLPVWPVFTIEQCKLEIDQLPGLWKSYLTSLGEAGPYPVAELQEHKRRTLQQPEAGYPAARGDAFGLSSRPDRSRYESRRFQPCIHRLHSRRPAGIGGIDTVELVARGMAKCFLRHAFCSGSGSACPWSHRGS